MNYLRFEWLYEIYRSNITRIGKHSVVEFKQPTYLTQRHSSSETKKYKVFVLPQLGTKCQLGF